MKIKTVFTALAVGLAAALAGCSTDGAATMFSNPYSMKRDAGYQIPSIPQSKIPEQYRRKVVTYFSKEAPGTIVIDTGAKHLYYVMGGGKAMRYGIGVGREGFEWKGTSRIALKREWPVWTPPKEMIARKPELAKWAGGQPGGLENPLGARALYIFKDGQDTGYRVHGSPEWWSIGQAMSSGCVRLINQDIIDLYSRVNGKTPIVVG